MDFLKKNGRVAALTLLVVSNICVWIAVAQKQPSNLLRVYFLDVGQGDAVFIHSPTHGRILLDGGPNRRVLAELGKILPFGDRRIDVVIESHPDKDHIGGLPDVVNRYDVGLFLEPGVESPNKVDDKLRVQVGRKQIPHLLARRGMTIDLGDETKLLILFPNQDISSWETNDASIVAKLVYKNTSFLLTGDSTKKTEYILLGMATSTLKSTVLKVGHHGSPTSTSLPYVRAVSPEYAVISVGEGNTYGHPHKGVLENLQKVGAQILSTETMGGLIGKGTIQFETDGETVRVK